MLPVRDNHYILLKLLVYSAFCMMMRAACVFQAIVLGAFVYM
jgi:hypothetical protein